jgi:hypothetical protein
MLVLATNYALKCCYLHGIRIRIRIRIDETKVACNDTVSSKEDSDGTKRAVQRTRDTHLSLAPESKTTITDAH